MGELVLKDKDIAVPGETIAKGMDYLPAYGTYRDGDSIVAGRLGLVSIDGRLVKVIPLSGRYVPKNGDVIIGKVIDITFSGWRIDTNSAYSAMLSLKDGTSDFIERGADLTKYYSIGDYVMANIINVTSQKLVDLTMRGPGLRKLETGRIINVSCTKVPRIIGKQGSMIKMIKDATGCRILVGQNGIVWIHGEPEMEVKAVETIRKIESESHTAGLTDSIKEYLDSNGVHAENNNSAGVDESGL